MVCVVNVCLGGGENANTSQGRLLMLKQMSRQWARKIKQKRLFFILRTLCWERYGFTTSGTDVTDQVNHRVLIRNGRLTLKHCLHIVVSQFQF